MHTPYLPSCFIDVHRLGLGLLDERDDGANIQNTDKL